MHELLGPDLRRFIPERVDDADHDRVPLRLVQGPQDS